MELLTIFASGEAILRVCRLSIGRDAKFDAIQIMLQDRENWGQ